MLGKKVIFHVGAHKTATSLVQKYLRDKPEDFAPFGVRYISRSCANDYVGWGSILEKSPQLIRNRVAKELSMEGTKIVFASHENTIGKPFVKGVEGLYPRAHKNLLALKNALDKYDVSIVLSIRPQLEFLQSYYLQTVHQGGYATFSEWTSKLSIDTLSWLPVINSIRDVFGEHSLTLIDFREIKAGQKEFLKMFFQRVDSSIKLKPDYRPHRNPSISEQGLKIALAANPYLSDATERKVMRNFLQKNFSNKRNPRPKLVDDRMNVCFAKWYSAEYESITEGLPSLLI